MSGLILFAAAPATAEFTAGQLTENRTLLWEGTVRHYDVFVPSVYNGVQPLPLVVDLHGYSKSKVEQREISGFEALAESEGFVAVWPEGSGFLKAWNAGLCCAGSAGRKADDVGLVLAIIETLEDALRIDPARIYVTGLSNGGGLAHRLACEAAHIFAAAAPVAFPLPYEDSDACAPSRPIPVAMVMGLTDSVVPYTPGYFEDPLGHPIPLMGAQQSLAAWRNKNHCEGSAPDQVTPLVDTAVCETYTACAGDVETRLCSIVGHSTGYAVFFGGHLLYSNNSAYDVAGDSWNFMSRFTHPHPGDRDGDGTADENDAFPIDASETLDHDRDGTGDNADPDDDNDQWTDGDETLCETNPQDAASVPVDTDDDGVCDLEQTRRYYEALCSPTSERSLFQVFQCQFRAATLYLQQRLEDR